MNFSMQLAASDLPIVCFGYVSPGVVFLVDQYPEANGGAYVLEKRPFIGADCTMAAQTLAGWQVPVHLIGNALGDDTRGREALAELHAAGVRTDIPLQPGLRTTDEVDVSDRAGTRTFFVEHNPTVWDTLLTADLQAINNAGLLYVDWYVGEAVVRAMRYATARQVPIYLNVEYSLREPQRYLNLLQIATVVQARLTDQTADTEDPYVLGRAILAAGPQMVLITRGRHGALLMMNPDVVIDIPSPPVTSVDTQGAGAAFAAAAIYALRLGWSPQQVVLFATTAASIKCERFGLLSASVDEIRSIAFST